ncbi:hypothetical protein [Stappia sp.]|uniref:hypothetical protein n=1 Tax=Stappia sp. TaxID=1870903 RepID=UPI003C7DCF9A
MGRKLVPIFVWSAAVVLIVFGLLTIWLPIPTGVPLIAGGAFLILGTSRQAVRWLRARRRRNLDLNRLISGLEDRAPTPVAEVLRRSRPRLSRPPIGRGLRPGGAEGELSLGERPKSP